MTHSEAVQTYAAHLAAKHLRTLLDSTGWPVRQMPAETKGEIVLAVVAIERELRPDGSEFEKAYDCLVGRTS